MAITAGTAAAIVAGISALTAIGTSAFQASEAQKNRDWQEEMSNTAYQRAVKDLESSGLNPILAYSQGGANVSSVGNPTGSSLPSLSLPNSSRDEYYDRKLELDAAKLNLEQQNMDIKRENHERDMALDNLRDIMKSRTGFGR